MSVAHVIAEIESLGIRLWLDEGQLRYQAPKNVLTAELRNQLVAQKPAIIAFLAQARQSVIPTIQPVVRDVGTRIPLSFAQQRLWFLAQLEDNSSFYNIPTELHLHGPLNLQALAESFRLLEVRHEMLRTTFPEVAGQAYQQIHLPNFTPELIDLTDLPEAQQAAEVARRSRLAMNYRFDLANGPLWQVSLLRLNATAHVLLLTLHHTIADGWSMGILMHELSALYAQVASEAPINLPALAIQYADYAVWQRQWLQGEELQAQLAYWRQQLADAPPLLTLPTDYPRPAVQSGQGDHVVLLLPPELVRQIKQLAQAQNATLFMTLQAAFSVLLARYSGQDDILIGTPIANRPLSEIEPLIGLFLNALVLRNNLSGNPTFRALLAQVRQTALAAFQYQAIPFELLVETLQPERSLAHSPIFQVMFNLLNNRTDALTLPGVTVQHREVEYAVAKHDLVLVMQELEPGMYAVFEYSTDLFARATIERMAGHFQVLLEAIVANPDQPVGGLPLLTAAERQQLLVEWNSDITANAGDACYHTLFELQAAQSPEAEAIRWQPAPGAALACLSYHELNEQANQLAHHLRACGVGSSFGPAAIVGVCLERSAETIISLLAIFKAGGVYMPLDPALPDERISTLLTQSGARMILTQQQYVARLAGQDAAIICFDADAELLTRQPTSHPINYSTPAHLAYVLFTSGSTGVPKGVMIEHRGMLNNLRAKIHDHGLTARDKLAQTAPPGFDISLWQFLAVLLVGGTVRIFSDEIARDPVALLCHTEQERITVLEVVPSLFRFMLDELNADGGLRPSFAALRWLSLTGEALPPNLCNLWLASYPHIPILNAYGPAECSDDSTHHIITAPFPPDTVTVPIGRPLPNVRLYVLDKQLQLVPIGVPGELCIGGIGVGRGYLNDPERTTAVFLPNPFVADPDARLYRTGDAARYRADGTLEFLGRLDNQVKLRGFRIELGEIEAVLDQHEAVEQSVVVLQIAANGEQHLVAYVTRNQREEILSVAPQWREFLAKRLPSYMLPSHFVVLDTLPLTPNGKIDRKRIPALDAAQSGAADRYVLPRTPTEALLVRIWQEVLRLERIGIHDHFFAIGGHSLLATQVTSRLRQHFQVEVALRTIFSAPTIAELAEQIDHLILSRTIQQLEADPTTEREEISL